MRPTTRDRLVLPILLPVGILVAIGLALWGVSALEDQLIAGLVMKIAGGLILWGFIAVIFFNWHAREQTGWDALGLQQVGRDVRTRVAR